MGMKSSVSAAMIESDMNMVENEYYDGYSEYMDEYYDEYSDYNELYEDNEEHLFDDNGEAWIVSNEAISSDYDTKWNNDDVWDEINNGIVTKTGTRISRKCLHMWGQRLCLCQFLDWMDSHKYKCIQNT